MLAEVGSLAIMLVQGTWVLEESWLQINTLELRAIWLPFVALGQI